MLPGHFRVARLNEYNTNNSRLPPDSLERLHFDFQGEDYLFRLDEDSARRRRRRRIGKLRVLRERCHVRHVGAFFLHRRWVMRVQNRTPAWLLRRYEQRVYRNGSGQRGRESRLQKNS